jgi:hypothetical protein
MRALLLAVLVLIPAIACGAARSHAPRAALTRHGVRRCIQQARTSHGTLLANDSDSAGWNVHPSGGILHVTVEVGDEGTTGAEIAFVGDAQGAQRLLHRLPYVPRFSTGAQRRRGVVLFDVSGDPEIRRIVAGCLGGPPYRGDGGTPPPLGLPPPQL